MKTAEEISQLMLTVTVNAGKDTFLSALKINEEYIFYIRGKSEIESANNLCSVLEKAVVHMQLRVFQMQKEKGKDGISK